MASRVPAAITMASEKITEEDMEKISISGSDDVEAGSYKEPVEPPTTRRVSFIRAFRKVSSTPTSLSHLRLLGTPVSFHH